MKVAARSDLGAKEEVKARARWGGQVDPAGTYGRVKELFGHLSTLQPRTLTLQIVNGILYFCGAEVSTR